MTPLSETSIRLLQLGSSNENLNEIRHPDSGSAACCLRTSPTAVPVMGPTSDLNALIGEWSGDYSNPETGRSGSIAFSLKVGKDTAVGSVGHFPSNGRWTVKRTAQ